MLNGLRLALGNEIKEGPWGGGNQFLSSFKTHLESKGAKVFFRLEDDLDVIILFNPRRESGTFHHKDVKRYKKRFPKARVIHRINETDKAKNTRFIDRLRLEANKVADAVIFISEWVRDYYISKGFDQRIPSFVIRNGPDENIFNSRGYTPWQPNGSLRVVTHHWSDNPMKGIDIYQYFDRLLNDPWMKRLFNFTYIGRYPKGVQLQQTQCVPPLFGADLARELKKHHVYLTAARWESCGMHQLEGACCGLPVLYIDEGGGVVETCRDAGIKFTVETFPVSLFKMREEYPSLQPKLNAFPFNARLMCQEYENVIEKILMSS